MVPICVKKNVVKVKGDKRVLRGGSWINNGRNVRSAIRNYNRPDNRNNNIGLRLAQAQTLVKMKPEDRLTTPCPCLLEGITQQAKAKGAGLLVSVAERCPVARLIVGNILGLFFQTLNIIE